MLSAMTPYTQGRNVARRMREAKPAYSGATMKLTRKVPVNNSWR